MLTESENKMLTEVGPATPMGAFMREYWVPIMRSGRVVAGAPPLRWTILGEPLVVFRSPGGAVGVMDEACPHRGASMALARNEECGLRCIYHGWQVNAAGMLVDAPTYPASVEVGHIKTRSHPVRESQGMIWTWLGKGEPPQFPSLAFTGLPDDHVLATTAVLNCNWLHPLETLWDVFHSQILHNKTNRSSARAKDYFSASGRKSGDLEFDYPTMRASRTSYGFTYTNSDAAKETNFHFVAPFIQFHTSTPGVKDDRVLQISVPIDDDHTLLWLIFYNRFAPLRTGGIGETMRSLPDLDDFLHGMGERGPDNLWGQDRAAMERGESFAGIVGMDRMTILAEDVCVIESQGRLDRTREMLTPIDRAVVEGRATLLDAVRAHQRGEPPIGRDEDLSEVEALFVSRLQEAG
ncbi:MULTISPECIES: Rieske 2Fe-2S domain-containing protein [Sphingobium]|uniref:Rieske 2Fe-2S domain-containing protein n=1 Tax=Sphingobium TaxID=165695 RepID=UPI0022EF405B|nr:Rieske 2Fe-2S domain-containing protein [Sphingobium sp. BS19]GLJ00277.1 ring-hydroxylating oxygenase subunit alpha [Sphingobium sp. BS19]